MPDIEELKDILWLYSTHENHPWSVDEAHAALQDSGDLVVDALIWGLRQTDIDMKLLILQLLQQHYTDANRALPAIRACIHDENRLVRVTAINTLHVMGDSNSELISLLTPKLDSSDELERLFVAANLWRICRSEDAYLVLRRALTDGDDSPVAMMARAYLDGTA